VQCIYFDPPYGIKCGSNWQVSTRKLEVKDGKAGDATRQPEQIRAFRDTWQLGIHSYLGYLRDRFVSARDLLTETGSIFVQIGDENVHLVRCVLDEVFGSETFCGQIVFKKTTGLTSDLIPGVCDYLLWYAKSVGSVKYRQLYLEKTLEDEVLGEFKYVDIGNGQFRLLTEEEKRNPQLIDETQLFRTNSAVSPGVRTNTTGKWDFEGNVFDSGPSRNWKTTYPGMVRLAGLGRLIFSNDPSRMYKQYWKDFPLIPLLNTWTDVRSEQDKIYVVQTVSTVVERCILMTTDPGDLILDPTCGSGTTAYVAEQWGRRWITIDTSRVALALARTRLMAARYPYYLLADSSDGVSKESDLTGKVPPSHLTAGDIKKGFVYKRVPHVTLKSIANNPDIREGMPRSEIEAAIMRHAESELLFDKPFEDNKRIRVTGPFTVESLSPHRVLSTDEERPKAELGGELGDAQFATMIIENLRKAGVQGTTKDQRIKFERLELHAGQWIQAIGEYQENGNTKRVAVSLGPEHGTVGPQQVKEAAKEAVQGVGYDTLIVCGFAFDPHVSEEVKRYGKLRVLAARMNPDLAMGDELLKKTGAGNLFMVFGEPDVKITKVKDGKLSVEIRGVDVYDPTTGEIRSSSTDDIACWFIDTDYNEESFFVRHAYFTGADEPYEKLQRALRAEIDEAAWRSLYSTNSRPFDPPTTGKIAIKVINHYGDEVLKVFGV